MKALPHSLQIKLQQRKDKNALRQLLVPVNLIDFSSNDYLGFAISNEFLDKTNALLGNKLLNGATGSRLLSGNHHLYSSTEKLIANFHQQHSALIFNSGYNANVGFFSAVPQRGDVVFYDELIHASIRDGLAMGIANKFNFKHNDLKDLETKLIRWNAKNKGVIYVVTESVFSMDGDSPDLTSLAKLCEDNSAYLIIDEAHALGVMGNCGHGLVQALGIQNKVFAQIVTFGKALGCHGAAILGDAALKEYLVNFSRSLIYTTALPPHAVASIQVGYSFLNQETESVPILKENIRFFKRKIHEYDLESFFIPSNSAIHCCIVSGVLRVKNIANKLQKEGFDVKAILSPTVPEGRERLRICLHSYNSFTEIETVVKLVSKWVKF